MIAVAREGEAPLRQTAKDFGISEGCLRLRLTIADRDDGIGRGTATKASLDQSGELREARKQIKKLELVAEAMHRAVAYWPRDVKDSGIGRENGIGAIEDYLDIKSVRINTVAPVGNPFVLE